MFWIKLQDLDFRAHFWIIHLQSTIKNGQKIFLCLCVYNAQSCELAELFSFMSCNRLQHKNIRAGAQFQVKSWKTKVNKTKELQKAKHIFLKKKIHTALVQKHKTQLLHLSAILLAIFIIEVSSFGCCLLCGMRCLHEMSPKTPADQKKCYGCTPLPLCVCSSQFSNQGSFLNEYACMLIRIVRILSCCLINMTALIGFCHHFSRDRKGQCLISGKELSFAKQCHALPWRAMLCQEHLFNFI